MLGANFYFADQIYLPIYPATSQFVPDVIVCLGGGRGRVSKAKEIWFGYHTLSSIPLLYFSGMGMTKETMLRAWKDLSADLISHIYVENESLNTLENAYWFMKYLEGHDSKTRGAPKKILLITSSYHMKRAWFIFNRVFEKHHFYPELKTYPVFQAPFSQQQWQKDWLGIQLTLSEYYKGIYYQLTL